MGIHSRATPLRAWSKRARAHTPARLRSPGRHRENSRRRGSEARVLDYRVRDRCPELISCQPDPFQSPNFELPAAKSPLLQPEHRQGASFSLERGFSVCLTLKAASMRQNFGKVLHVSPSDRELEQHEQHGRSLAGASPPQPGPRGWRMQTCVDLRASSSLCSWGENDFWVSSTGWVTSAWSPPLQEPVAISKTRV